MTTDYLRLVVVHSVIYS